MHQLFAAIYLEITYRRSQRGWPVSRQWIAENPAVWGVFCSWRAGHSIA